MPTQTVIKIFKKINYWLDDPDDVPGYNIEKLKKDLDDYPELLTLRVDDIYDTYIGDGMDRLADIAVKADEPEAFMVMFDIKPYVVKLENSDKDILSGILNIKTSLLIETKMGYMLINCCHT